jgi:type IV pilus assembly protein PilW
MNRCQQNGLSLVELMVAVAISLLLMMGVITIFIGSRVSYETTQRVSRIQENGRVALDQIVSELRSAGFQGCARPNPASLRANEFAITTLPNPTALLWNYAISAEGFDAGADLSSVITLSPVPNANSDILVVRSPRRDEPALKVFESQANPADPLMVTWDASSTVAESDSLMVSDCDGRAFFRVTSLAATGGGKQIAHTTLNNASDTLLHPFKKGAEVVPVQTAIYYVAGRIIDPGAVDPDDPSNFVPALWRKVGAAAPEEVADGVEQMEVLYGLDSAGGDARVDEYKKASDVTDWSEVVSVAVALLVRSPEPYGTEDDNRKYDLLGTLVGPFPDRYQRQVFTATVALRNHVFD